MVAFTNELFAKIPSLLRRPAMNIPIDLAWLEAVMLAGVRITAFLVIAPPFSHNAIPLRIKGMLAVGRRPRRLAGRRRRLRLAGHRRLHPRPGAGAGHGAALGFLV